MFFNRLDIQVGGAQFSTNFGFGGCRSRLGEATDRVFVQLEHTTPWRPRKISTSHRSPLLPDRL